MKFTYNWLKDFVNIKITPQALAEKLTMAGLEITAFEEIEGDFVFEAEVTSNRPDWLSIIGIAREVAAITHSKLKIQSSKFKIGSKLQTPSSKPTIKIKIEDKKDCPLYTARIIRNVKVGSSPEWMQKRLVAVGMRPVNNIVDITNYILMVTGEPLHAFDLDKFASSDEVVVRRAKAGEKIVSIDGQERLLDRDNLIIADSKKPVAIAGIIGGKDTEVTESTKNILLEAAKFSAILTRRSRQKLGLQTESSYRFERDVDIEMVDRAAAMAVALIQEIAGGELVISKAEPKQIKTKKIRIKLNSKDVSRILGVNIPTQEIKRILKSLGLSGAIPSFRQDIKKEIDLIEELSRIYGYDKIPVTIPKVTPKIEPNLSARLISLIKDVLIAEGVNEVITHSLISKAVLEKIGVLHNSDIEIANPLSREQEILRPTLSPGLLNCVAYNLNRREVDIKIFEIAKVFEDKEQLSLGLALCSSGVTYFHLKGILEVLLNRLGLKEFEFSVGGAFYLDGNESGALIIGGQRVGDLGKVRLEVLDKLEIKKRAVYVAEINLDKIFAIANLRKRFKPLPLYPEVTRDISSIVKEGVLVNDIIKSIMPFGSPHLQEIRVADCYKGEQVPAGFKALTLSLIYRCDDRTLTDAEVNSLHAKVCEVLVARFQAKLR